MIKFDKELEGYGFDAQADRVVRFNKHPDGTYLNTRATYSINKRQFTHYELRQRALASAVPVEKLVKVKTFKLWWIAAAFVVILCAGNSTCSVHFKSTVEEVK